MPNRLNTSTSPYMLQHAENPVNGYPWGDGVLYEAKVEGKLVFLSIGMPPFTGVMQWRTNPFKDHDTVALMNEHFMNIKVDREERPDIDSTCMTATIVMPDQVSGLHQFFSPRH